MNANKTLNDAKAIKAEMAEMVTQLRALRKRAAKAEKVILAAYDTDEGDSDATALVEWADDNAGLAMVASIEEAIDSLK